MTLKSLIAAFALVSVTAAAAQAPSLIGAWRGIAQVRGVTVEFDMVIQPNGDFAETERTRTLMTRQTGQIHFVAPSIVTFVVQDWQPRTMPVYRPNGAVGGYYSQQPTAKPPGGTWRLTWRGPNSVVMQDATFGGAVTFNRAG
jgi:hypothetical protein